MAVVGHTGAGKTTITNLLLRFYDVQRGAIRIGGVDIREFDPKQLRRHFGIVLQDSHLFTGTLADNIRLGDTDIPDDSVRIAAGQVNLTDFVASLPDGFGHKVRERGAGLSTGQKQLISFARALAREPRYLILDEATSSVDTETEFKVRDALDRMVVGRTSIVIAHRLSTIQRASRILVMHKTKLRESGTHQELLAARGIYWKLYLLQYKDQEARLARVLTLGAPNLQTGPACGALPKPRRALECQAELCGAVPLRRRRARMPAVLSTMAGKGRVVYWTLPALLSSTRLTQVRTAATPGRTSRNRCRQPPQPLPHSTSARARPVGRDGTAHAGHSKKRTCELRNRKISAKKAAELSPKARICCPLRADDGRRRHSFSGRSEEAFVTV